MSRTYRCRHLPRIEVRKQKITYHYDKDWKLSHKSLGLVQYKILKYTDGCNHRKAVVANASWHPWIHWWTRVNKAGIKRWYRTVGNRAFRHKIRQLLKDERMWEEVLPLREEYVDWWDLY